MRILKSFVFLLDIEIIFRKIYCFRGFCDAFSKRLFACFIGTASCELTKIQLTLELLLILAALLKHYQPYPNALKRRLPYLANASFLLFYVNHLLGLRRSLLGTCNPTATYAYQSGYTVWHFVIGNVALRRERVTPQH